jgi:hypothetical protein
VGLCDVVGFQDLNRRENPSPAIGLTKQSFKRAERREEDDMDAAGRYFSRQEAKNKSDLE